MSRGMRSARKVAVGWRLGVLAAVVLAVLAEPVGAAEQAGRDGPAVVCNVKVLSDKVEDFSSLDAWVKALEKRKPGMSDKEKVFAAWEAAVKFHHHDMTPMEYRGWATGSCTDAVALFNVYGYCTGSGAHTAYLQMLRALGIEARAWSVVKWGVVEAKYDGGWHYLDPGMQCYFLKPDGVVASVEEIEAGIKAWYEAHPGYLGDEKKLKEFLKESGVEKGPEILRNCPTYDPRGAYPLNFFAWTTTMLVFNGSKKDFLYEEPHTQGHVINVQLHRGETLTRYWDAEHLPADWFKEKKPDCLGLAPGKGALYYTPKFGDLTNGRVGSGEVVYTVPLDGSLADAALAAENLEFSYPGPMKKTVPGIGVKDAGKPGVLVFDRFNGYLYASAKVDCTVWAPAGSITAQVSVDNGRSWQEADKFAADNGNGGVFDLSPLVARRYHYQLKLTFTGAGTGLAKLKITEQFQCSQRALPALGREKNTIQCTVGPQEGTRTVTGTNAKFKDHNPTWADLGVTFDGIDPEKDEWGAIVPPAGKAGSVTVPIAVPGDLKRLRFGGQYRAGDKAEGWDYQVSFDDGKSWQTVGRAAGPVRTSAHYIACEAIPAGTRKCLVRYQADSKGNVVLFEFRVDADYVQPAGGLLPVEVTYGWEEVGQAKQQQAVLKDAALSFDIECADTPKMQSLTLAVSAR